MQFRDRSALSSTPPYSSVFFPSPAATPPTPTISSYIFIQQLWKLYKLLSVGWVWIRWSDQMTGLSGEYNAVIPDSTKYSFFFFFFSVYMQLKPLVDDWLNYQTSRQLTSTLCLRHYKAIVTWHHSSATRAAGHMHTLLSYILLPDTQRGWDRERSRVEHAHIQSQIWNSLSAIMIIITFYLFSRCFYSNKQTFFWENEVRQSGEQLGVKGSPHRPDGKIILLTVNLNLWWKNCTVSGLKRHEGELFFTGKLINRSVGTQCDRQNHTPEEDKHASHVALWVGNDQKSKILCCHTSAVFFSRFSLTLCSGSFLSVAKDVLVGHLAWFRVAHGCSHAWAHTQIQKQQLFHKISECVLDITDQHVAGAVAGVGDA